LFEFGTFDGRSSVNLLLNSPEAHLYTLDLPPDVRTLPEEAKVGERLRRPEFEGRYTQLFGDSRTFDFSPYAGQMDLIFIDAGHAYEFVKNDTQRALEMVKRDSGVIIWHDFGQIPGVTRAVEALYASGQAPGELARVRQTSLAVCTPRGSEEMLNAEC
jgi:predicted O-methyltransferase YrrM